MQVQTPLAWAFDHLNLIGWPSICFVVYKFARFLDRMQHRAAVVEENVNNIATNHLDHMQKSLESIDGTMQRQEDRWNAWLAAQAARNHDD
jgi:hypothetical protein